MTIARLTAYHVLIPLTHTVEHASFSRDDSDSIIVRCDLSDGSVGWGEGVPREYVTGETIDDAWQLLQTTNLAEQLAGDFSDPGAAITALDSLQITPPQSPTESTRLSAFISRDCFGNSVRCAIELAVLDAVCRSAGVPLSRITELVPETEPIRQQAAEVRYSGAITAMNPAQQIHSAIKHWIYGFAQVKVKAGMGEARDLGVLRRVRRILGSKIDVRLDPNEAWTCENLEAKLAPLLPYRISAVEQPVPHEEIGGLARIRQRLDVPFMLDESLCSFSDGQRAIDENLCDLFNIRISKCGGFIPSLRLVALAHEAGLGYQLGCQVGETGILSAAGRHFATSVGGLRYLEGSYDRFLVRERVTVDDLTIGFGGRGLALAGPGLGVRIDDDALSRVLVRTQTVLE